MPNYWDDEEIVGFDEEELEELKHQENDWFFEIFGEHVSDYVFVDGEGDEDVDPEDS